MKAYLAQAQGPKAKHGAVVVVHAVGGISPHIEDVARRLAVDGFMALASISCRRSAERRCRAIPKWQRLTRSLKPEETTGNAVAAANYLRSLPEVERQGRRGRLLLGRRRRQPAGRADPMLNVGVPFYGATAAGQRRPEDQGSDADQLRRPRARQDLGMAAPAYEEALKKAGTRYEIRFYPGAQHAFNDDTGRRYHPEAAKLAWSRTLRLFKQTCRNTRTQNEKAAPIKRGLFRVYGMSASSQDRDRRRIRRQRERLHVGVDVGDLLVGQHALRVGRHDLTRRAQLHDERRDTARDRSA